MTKKYWADWQKRIGETKQIWYSYSKNGSCSNNWSTYLINESNGDRIIKADFHNDAVDLIIERHNRVINWNTCLLKQHIENEYKTLHRNEISRIDFIKYE